MHLFRPDKSILRLTRPPTTSCTRPLGFIMVFWRFWDKNPKNSASFLPYGQASGGGDGQTWRSNELTSPFRSLEILRGVYEAAFPFGRSFPSGRQMSSKELKKEANAKYLKISLPKSGCFCFLYFIGGQTFGRRTGLPCNNENLTKCKMHRLNLN